MTDAEPLEAAEAPETKSGAERRRFRRVKMDLPGRMFLPSDSREAHCTVLDMSPGGVAVASQIVRILKPGGVVLAFFNTHEPKEPAEAVYTKHVVVDQSTLQYRPYPAARGKQRPFQNRDIQRMFAPLRVAEQFLLQSHMREMLLRKPDHAAPADI